MAAALSLVMVASTARIVLAATAGHSPVVPAQPALAGWLQSIAGEQLTYDVFLIGVVAFTVAYGALLALVRTLPTRAVVGLIAVLYAIVFIGPILVSTDVFSYIAYARMGILHGLNPYASAPFAIHHDPSYRYVGSDWIFVPTAYGPFYTLLSFPFGLLGMAGAVWGMKALALAACVAVDWLTWRCARLRDVDARLALLAVGANPLVVIYSLGSAQNDLLMVALMMVGIDLTLSAPSASGRRRDLRHGFGAAATVLGALVKVPAGVVLPYMLIARRRVAAVAGAVATLAVGLGASYVVFGSRGIDLLSGANRDSGYVSVDSFATKIGHLLGKPGVYPIDHMILRALLVLVFIYLLWRTWRGYDWIAASGWTLLAMSVTATWVQPWYLIWPLPLAVLSRDRRLLWGTLLIQALFVIHQLPPLFIPQ